MKRLSITILALAALIAGQTSNALAAERGRPATDNEDTTATLKAMGWNVFNVTTPDGLSTPAMWKIPEGEGPFPGIVYFHGAPGGIGLQGLRGDANAPRWPMFLEAGIAVCVSDYRGHPPDQPFEVLHGDVTAMDDAAAVIQYVKALPVIDAARVAAIGHSLGSVVVLETIVREPVACAVMSAPPAFDFVRDMASAKEKIQKIECPVLFIVGAQDGLSRFSVTLNDMMKEAGKDSRLEIFEGQGHPFTNRPPGSEAYNRAWGMMVDFVKQHTAAKSAEPVLYDAVR